MQNFIPKTHWFKKQFKIYNKDGKIRCWRFNGLGLHQKQLCMKGDKNWWIKMIDCILPYITSNKEVSHWWRQCYDWPAQVSDLNIIEHMWRNLKIYMYNRKPKNLQELWVYSMVEHYWWNNLLVLFLHPTSSWGCCLWQWDPY